MKEVAQENNVEEEKVEEFDPIVDDGDDYGVQVLDIEEAESPMRTI
jgi:hypothetical protein